MSPGNHESPNRRTFRQPRAPNRRTAPADQTHSEDIITQRGGKETDASVVYSSAKPLRSSEVSRAGAPSSSRPESVNIRRAMEPPESRPDLSALSCHPAWARPRARSRNPPTSGQPERSAPPIPSADRRANAPIVPPRKPKPTPGTNPSRPVRVQPVSVLNRLIYGRSPRCAIDLRIKTALISPLTKFFHRVSPSRVLRVVPK
jgi:hypothetical protein